MARPDILLAALVGLVAASPVMLAVAVIVRCALGSPVMFRQERAGKRGRPFTMVKFRTMTNARDAEGRLLPDRERTPATGRFLRRTRLDELPELWSIARGEMAFIGPRPLLPETIVGAGSRGRLRGLVLPGLTGWAQVNGNASLTNDEKIELDLWYIRNRSLALDLRIFAKTVAVVVRGERKALAVTKDGEP
ncbi:MAG: sugar transferase [Novosphingobium sp.]|nr:MAG: sugar transferase [Novosphingobium sp.]